MFQTLILFGLSIIFLGYVLICLYYMPLIPRIILTLSIIISLLGNFEKYGLALWFIILPITILIGTLSILNRFRYPPKTPPMYARAPMG